MKLHQRFFITKDETTTQFFNRFNRVVINGQTWEVQGFNDNYGTSSKNSTGGIIRVALKETYTSTNQVINSMLEQEQKSSENIIGPEVVQTYDVVRYYVPDGQSTWDNINTSLFKILSQSQNQIKLQVLQVNQKTETSISYGNGSFDITIKPFK